LILIEQSLNEILIMTRKPYRLGRRGEAAEETRRRIVEACFAVHVEQGIAATSMKDIAERADVSIGTVYHHFPTYDDMVMSCGQFAVEKIPAPSAAIFDGLVTRAARVGRLAREIFAHFDELPVDMVRCDQDRVPVLRPFVAAEESHRIELVRVALGASKGQDRLVQVVAALLDVSVYRALRRAGLSLEQAAAEIATVILARLAQQPAAAVPRKG
jgi:AcrR family transcriptional regulator